MGNSSTKESRSSGENARSPTSPASANFPGHAGDAHLGSRAGRGSRHDVSFFGIATTGSAQETRKETRQEREARKLEKERALRLKERERSLREEGVDGGYLVTLGTYTGPEDFSKTTVRQLMIERRIAPFWRGLNDHSDSWTEHQLVAVARGKPLPAPDEIPEEENLTPTTTAQAIQTGAMAVPGAGQVRESTLLSASHPVASNAGPLSPSSLPPSSASPLFRGRAKTLATLASSSKNTSQTEITPQEIQSPHDPYINGMRIEAYLYKDVLECPICFMYYPPYLNRTRCCDQPICSECFVQIKRPDPHPPEHLDPNTPVPEGPPRPEEGSQLVSEPATCPFCVREEFGVTYQPPSFRRGLVYAGSGTRMARTNSAMSSTSDLSGVSTPVGSSPPPTFNRRRTESLSASAPTVITTDKVRPDWAKKLSDARAHQARRSAAATALHTAAYLMGDNQGSSASHPFTRRRRADTTGSNGPTGQAGPDIEQLMAALESRRIATSHAGGGADLWPPRGSSQRASTAQDIEEIMLMEAIRLSLAAEEERKKKEEKEAAKQAKKDEKQKAKDQKKADKVAKKDGLYSSSANSSTMLSSYGGHGGPTSPTEESSSAPIVHSSTDDTAVDGKGKARATSAESNGPPEPGIAVVPLAEPTSTINTGTASAREDPQKHLEQSRAHIIAESGTTASSPVATPGSLQRPGNRLRGGSNASYASSVSSTSYNESGLAQPSPNHDEDETPPSSSLEPMFNFSSLAEMIGKQARQDGTGYSVEGGGAEHIEHDTSRAAQNADNDKAQGEAQGKYGTTNVGIIEDDIAAPSTNQTETH